MANPCFFDMYDQWIFNKIHLFFEGYMKDLKESWPLFLLVVFIVLLGKVVAATQKTMSKSETQTSDSVSDWLLNDKNYANKEKQRKVFITHFDEAIAKNNYDEAKRDGDMIFSFFAYDSVYHRTLEKFIEKQNNTLVLVDNVVSDSLLEKLTFTEKEILELIAQQKTRSKQLKCYLSPKKLLKGIEQVSFRSSNLRKRKTYCWFGRVSISIKIIT